jgi:hypothetical protein
MAKKGSQGTEGEADDLRDEEADGVRANIDRRQPGDAQDD